MTKPIKLEVGKRYRRRDGLNEHIHTYVPDEKYPFFGLTIQYSGNGLADAGYGNYDIIEEITEGPEQFTSALKEFNKALFKQRLGYRDGKENVELWGCHLSPETVKIIQTVLEAGKVFEELE